MERLKLLQEFESFDVFVNILQQYQNSAKQTFVISDSHKLKEPYDNVNKNCIYKNVKYVCVYGSQRHQIGKNNFRETRYV